MTDVQARLLRLETIRRRFLQSELFAAREKIQQLHNKLMESRRQERLARHEALHDRLTGLPNRRFLERQLSGVFSRNLPQVQSLVLMYIDLDGFKKINDQHGHSVGDAVLGIIGARLSRCLRTRDAVSRHGGDEFICLLRGVTHEDQVVAVVRKFQAVISANCQVDTLSLSVSPSIGIARYPRDGGNVATLIEKANRAMRWAKQRRLGHAFADQIPVGSPLREGEARVKVAE